MFSSTSYPLNVIGNYITSGGSQPAGYMDDVRIYDFVLSIGDIEWLYNDGSGRSSSLGAKEVGYRFLTEKGNYRGTYSFEDDTIGGNPDNWEVYEGTGSSTNILGSLDGHNNIIEISTTTTGSGHYADAAQEFSEQTYGTIEFWWRGTDVDYYHANYINLYDGATNFAYSKIEPKLICKIIFEFEYQVLYTVKFLKTGINKNL